jgi:hypothetical protein
LGRRIALDWSRDPIDEIVAFSARSIEKSGHRARRYSGTSAALVRRAFVKSRANFMFKTWVMSVAQLRRVDAAENVLA